MTQTGKGGYAWALRLARVVIAVLAFASLHANAQVHSGGQTKTVGGLTVSLGTIPAEVLKGFPHNHPQASIHGGPGGGHEYHVVAAVFDSETGVRITDARVLAQVQGPALAGPRKPLEPITIGGVVAYGGYFDLPDNAPYTIRLQIDRSGSTVRVDFDYGGQ